MLCGVVLNHDAGVCVCVFLRQLNDVVHNPDHAAAIKTVMKDVYPMLYGSFRVYSALDPRDPFAMGFAQFSGRIIAESAVWFAPYVRVHCAHCPRRVPQRLRRRRPRVVCRDGQCVHQHCEQGRHHACCRHHIAPGEVTFGLWMLVCVFTYSPGPQLEQPHHAVSVLGSGGAPVFGHAQAITVRHIRPCAQRKTRGWAASTWPVASTPLAH